MQKIKNFLINGSFSFIVKYIYEFIILILLEIEFLQDIFFQKSNQILLNENVTIIIKTFERPSILKRSILSIRRFYPNIRIVVVDDSKESLYIKDVEYYKLSYDVGVSEGRNIALSYVKTKYTLVIDDDFIFNRNTDILSVYEKLENNPDIDIVAGSVINLPFYTKNNYLDGFLHPSNASSKILEGTIIDSMVVHDKVPNFYLARTDSIRKVAWDSRIKRLDHADFFTRAKGVLVSTVYEKFRVLHSKTPFDKKYMSIRMNLESDHDILQMKFY